jgi:signal transduction histidine kinase
MIPLSLRFPGRCPAWLAAPVRAMRFAVENTLGRRVITWMLLCSLGLALVSTAGQLYVNYRRDIAQIEQRLVVIERSSMSALTSAVWNLDQAQLKAQLADIVALPDMSSAAFVDARGKTMAEAGDPTKGAIVRVIPILTPAEHSGSRLELGRLTIRASLAGVYDDLRDDAVLTLISKAGEIFLVSFMMLLIFRGLVSRPLSDLARSAALADPLIEPLELRRRPHADDDFDLLVRALNSMRSSLKRDFDDLATARSALVASEERYRSLVESTNVVGWEYEAGKRSMTFIGPQIVGLLGHPIETWRTRGFAPETVMPESLADLDAALQGSSDRINVECCLRTADGHGRWFAALADRREEAAGILWQGHLVDIDARKRGEQELEAYRHELELRVVQRTADLDAKVAELEVQREEQRVLIEKLETARNQAMQAEKLASIGQLAAGVAHEINNPIGFVLSNFKSLERYMTDVFTVIAAYEAVEGLVSSGPQLAALRQAKEDAELDFVREDVKQLLIESCDGLDRVKRIVQDLKDFSRVGENGWQTADLVRGIESTLNVVRNEIKYKAEVVKRYGATPEVECMPSQLNQVFMNLLVNAGHAIAEHGTITIASGSVEDQVWIAISDTGSGIAPEVLGRIFDPFFTTKPVGQGTGLGLSLSYSIVRRHGGRIEVESEVGVGTTFRVWLPIRQVERPREVEVA